MRTSRHADMQGTHTGMHGTPCPHSAGITNGFAENTFFSFACLVQSFEVSERRFGKAQGAKLQRLALPRLWPACCITLRVWVRDGPSQRGTTALSCSSSNAERLPKHSLLGRRICELRKKKGLHNLIKKDSPEVVQKETKS